MMILGLTGSIGMGKSTTAEMFRRNGVPVFDADQCVHDLYQKEAVELIDAAFPGVASSSGIDRLALGVRVMTNPNEMARLEAIIHPMVRARRQVFLKATREARTRLAVLDIPLLFETGAETEVDAVVVVSAPADVQRARVLSRPAMNEAKLAAILARQRSDKAKRRSAHFIVDTSWGLAEASRQVNAIIKALAGCDHGDGHCR